MRDSQLWQAAQWTAWFSGIILAAVAVTVFALTTFETKSDAAKSFGEVRADASQRDAELKTDVREIRQTLNKLYEMEKGR